MFAPITFINDPTVPMAERLADAKAKYNALGFAVIPLRINPQKPDGKAPACKDWHGKTASFDFDVGKCSNIGVVCGEASGICCIDVDLKDDGMACFQKMLTKYHLPHCPTQETPNGGRHYIFKYNKDRMANMRAQIKALCMNGRRIGVDMWIKNCQFVVEPSINHLVGKSYKWIVPLTTKDAIPELPQWLYDAYQYRNIHEDGSIIMDDASLILTCSSRSLTDSLGSCTKNDMASSATSASVPCSTYQKEYEGYTIPDVSTYATSTVYRPYTIPDVSTCSPEYEGYTIPEQTYAMTCQGMQSDGGPVLNIVLMVIAMILMVVAAVAIAFILIIMQLMRDGHIKQSVKTIVAGMMSKLIALF